MADKLFDRYPRGFCLFLLAGEQKSYIFGPDFEHPLYDFTDHLANELRQNLRHQLPYLQETKNPKHLYLFYCERTGYTAENAFTKASALKQFLNEKVFKAYFCTSSPIHLKTIPYEGYVGGSGIDKKKNFAAFIQYRQNKFETEPRTLVTLEHHACEPTFVFPGCDSTCDVSHPQIITEIIEKYPPSTLTFAIVAIVMSIAVFVPLLVLSIVR